VGPPDSPVVHRTGTVHCPVRLLAPALTLRAQSAHCSVVSRPLRLRPLLRLAHRTVRCYIGQSGATPDCPVNYSGVAPQKPEAEQFGVNLPGAPDSPVHQTRAAFGYLLLLSFKPFLGLFIGLC
jgi:hypothetical protein